MFGGQRGSLLVRVLARCSVGVKNHLRVIGGVRRNVDAIVNLRCFSSPNAPGGPPDCVAHPHRPPLHERPRRKYSRRDITLEESLAGRYPALARELHPTKNNDAIDARKLTPDSEVRVWWKCVRGKDHEWETSVQTRARRGYGCPFCSHRRVSVTNSLRTLAPVASLQWHDERNGKDTPDTVVGTRKTKKYWFIGPVAYVRVKRGGNEVAIFEAGTILLSPHSVSALESPDVKGVQQSKHQPLAVEHPELASFWHPSRNTRTPDAVTVQSTYLAWWKCGRGHEFQTRVDHVTLPRHGVVPQVVPCRQCAMTASPGTSVLDLHPEVAAEYDAEKNERPVYEVLPASGFKYWFRCRSCGWSWKAQMNSRTRAAGSAGCPECARLRGRRKKNNPSASAA